MTVQAHNTEEDDPRIGQRLGDYVIRARVADGAMGRVYAGQRADGAEDGTASRVAIKVLHGHVARDQVAVERFRREFESAQEMDHPHVVKVLDFGKTPDGSHFMVMEYLEGEELGELLRREGKIAPERVVRIVCQAASALDYAHSFGFIHRDLKPDNIFLCRSPEGDRVRLLDFGSVKLQMETGPKLTAIGTTLGSPYYMSPEQAMGRQDVDQRTDVFALTAILYEMLTGRVAFEAPNVAQILMRIMNESPAPVSVLIEGVPPAVDDVIDEGLSKEKTDRFDSVLTLAQRFVAALGLEGTPEVWAEKPQATVAEALARVEPPPSAAAAGQRASGVRSEAVAPASSAAAASIMWDEVTPTTSPRRGSTGLVVGAILAVLVVVAAVVAMLR